jgi:hypothetical protein
MLSSNQNDRECIKVCVRVRPLLSHERNRSEVIYYPKSGPNDTLDVRKIFKSLGN